MSVDLETLEGFLAAGTLNPGQLDAIRAVLAENERLRAIKRSDTEMIEECRKELAELANNRDGLEHDWSERGARIDAALKEADAALEMFEERSGLEEVVKALKGEA